MLSYVLFACMIHVDRSWALPQVQYPNNTVRQYVLPMFEMDVPARSRQLQAQREGYLYGPPLMGNTSFFPTGKLGDKLVQEEVKPFVTEIEQIDALIMEDQKSAQATVQASGLKEPSDYLKFYDGEYNRSNPTGVNPGYLTNYTQDLFFSMGRLTQNPFAIRRIDPKEALPYAVADNITIKLTSMKFDALHRSGRLFIVDHSLFATLPVNEGRYSAGCSAYFYISPITDQLLPLAIKTNVGKNLVYTPADTANDWMLAKMMFNSNDAFWSDVFHLANTHDVAEIVHEAALRTMADQHPLRGLMDRIMYRAYAVRPIGAKYLVNPGGNFDQNFALGSSAVATFVHEVYHASAGSFVGNYRETWFQARGLVNCTYGPPLSHFPYYEDTTPIPASIRKFVTEYVNAFYISDDLVAKDTELQAWVAEANGPALVREFPAAIKDKAGLVDVLTQIAYLAGVLHHTLNSGSLAASWFLPLHSAAQYAPIPDTKGVTDLMPFLPNLELSLRQIALFNGFNRPNLIGADGDLETMFADSQFLTASYGSIRKAAATFQQELKGISDIQAKKAFGSDGLCQGAPFIWKSVDPMRIPFFLSI